jgi:YqaJ-like viral recombinase domain
MIMHDVEQGSAAWLRLRLGVPTASEFHRILTPARGELSKQARGYAHQLVAETLLGAPLESSVDTVAWVARGKLLEPEAVRHYEITTDVETRPIGFITTDDGRIGCSPDRLLVGSRGALEVKCPSPATHVGYLVDGLGDAYRCQVQGQLAVAELDHADFLSYHPGLPPVLLRTGRDEPFIFRLRSALSEFLDLRDAMLATARATGFFALPRADTPILWIDP